MIPSISRVLTRVVFCPNQITTTIALGMARSIGSPQQIVVVYSPARCDVSALQAQGVICHAFSRTVCLKILLRYGLIGQIECILPHRRLGRTINGFAALCASLAIVDDGLDTLRDTPKNIECSDFPVGTAFYTFTYSSALGRWLSRFEVRPVATLSMLAETGRPRINLRGVRRLVVESPHLDRIQADLDLANQSTLVVRHSSIVKQTLKWPGMRTINGADVSIEGSLDDYEGEVVTGETMVAVYALFVNHSAFTLKIHLTAEQADNLEPLIAMVQAHESNAQLVIKP